MEKKSSNISGFIDGYKAGNLSLMSNNFYIKKNDISFHIDNILNNLKDINSNEINNFDSEIRSLKSSILYGLDSFDSWQMFGESLNSILDSYKKLNRKTQDLLFPDIKKVIYHFIDLAKKSEEPKLIEIAIEVGENL